MDNLYLEFNTSWCQINSAGIYMTTGQYIINIITTIMLTLSVIATIFSGINYLKDGKDLFKD